MYETRNSVYCYPGTNTLVNKLNIKDSATLDNYETSMVSLKLMALDKKGITGNFDAKHFVSIHKFLFEDIYPFAGLFRTENIAKDYFQFAEWSYIESELNRLLTELKNENYLSGLSKGDFTKRLAYYWSELNVLHPFREGNGRTTREFLRQLALKNNYILNLKNVDAKEFLNASIKSIIDTTDLERLLYICIEKV
ncbi:MAG: Fic/DOC family protein [Clostridia bacterium]